MEASGFDRIYTHPESAHLLRQTIDEPIDNTNGSKRTGFRKGDMILTALAVTFMLIFVTFVVLFSGAQQKLDSHPPYPPNIATTTLPVPTPTSPPLPPSASPTICLTPSCILISAQILSQIDTSVDPCEDPYGWATGGWRKRNPLPPSKGVWNSFHLLASQNQRVLLDVLREEESKGADEVLEMVKGEVESDEGRARSENVEKLRKVFKGCVDQAHLNTLGLKPLRPILSYIRTLFPATFPPPLPSQFHPSYSQDPHPAVLPSKSLKDVQEDAFVAVRGIRDGEEPFGVPALVDENGTGMGFQFMGEERGKEKQHYEDGSGRHKGEKQKEREEKLTNVLAFLHSKAIPTLFTFQPQGDIGKAPQNQILWLVQSPLGLPSPQYYSSPSIMAFYTRTIASLLTQTLPHSQTHLTDTLAKRIVSLEGELSRAGAKPEDLIDPSKAYNPMSFQELDKALPIDLTAYIESFLDGKDGGGRVIGREAVVTSKEYLREMGKILRAEEDWVLQAWFGVRAAMEYGPFLGDGEEVRKRVEELRNLLAGVKRPIAVDREEVCVAHVSSVLGHLLSAEFVQRKFTDDAKQQAETIINDIVDAFKTRLEKAIPWMDKTSSEAAIEKASAIVPKIGYPLYPNATSPVDLQQYYASQLVSERDFFGNVLRAKTSEVERSWKDVGRERDSDSWVMLADEVNAYFSPSDNEIHFPAGILQPPFFGPDLPSFINYGAFGAVAAHEITHAFDSSGAQYDAQGFYRRWWTNSTFDAFNTRSQCIAKQYSQYWLEGPDGERVYENGNLTNTEDIGDSGVRFAYQAWKNHLKRTNAQDPILPGLNYTSDQLFFAAFGSPWANNQSPASALAQIRTDEHSIRQFRVLGPLTNFEVFAEVFECPVGSKVNPGERCELW